MKFQLPDGQSADVLANSIEGFPVRTPEDFLAFLRAQLPDPVTGQPAPDAVSRFLDGHPTARAFIERLMQKPVPASYGQASYHAEHAFLFTAADGMSRCGRYRWMAEAVDQDGNVLDILVQSRRNKKAAKKFFRKLLKDLTYVPRVIVTDQLQSYGAAKREILPGVAHRQHRYLNNRAENSQQRTRQRERRMQGFKVPGHAQRFLAAYRPIAQHFRPCRHRLSASAYRQEMQQRFNTWREITSLPTAA